MATTDERSALWAAYWALKAAPLFSPILLRAAEEIWLHLDDDAPPPPPSPSSPSPRHLQLVGTEGVTS